MEPSIDFGRIDCSLMHDLCEELNVGDTPSMLFLPAENVEYNHTFPRLPTVDSIVLFLNEHLGTHRVVDGGLDETYGRDAVLDELAEQFLNVEMKVLLIVGECRNSLRDHASCSKGEKVI